MFTIPFCNVPVPPPVSFRKIPSKSQLKSAAVLTLLDRTLVHRNYNPNNVGTHVHVPDATAKNRSAQRRTEKLRFNYLTLIQMLQTIVYDERTGQWELHMYVDNINMIPVFHAAGHMEYACSARRYAMCRLPDVMDHRQFQKLSTEGYFTF